MEESFKLILLWILVGSFTGYFYWLCLFAFCSGFYMQYLKAKKNERIALIFVHMTFVPTVALIGLGLFAAYNAITDNLSVWFVFGSSWPVLLIIYNLRDKKDG